MDCLDHMIHVFPSTGGVYQDIEAAKTPNQRNRELCTAVTRAGKDAFKLFIVALWKTGRKDLSAKLADGLYPDKIGEIFIFPKGNFFLFVT